MATYLIPEAIAKTAVGFDIQMTGNIKSNTSKMNNATQTVEFPGDLWSIRMEFAPRLHQDFYAHEAFWNRFRGIGHRLMVWHLAHWMPSGTLRSGAVVNGIHAAGSNTLAIRAAGSETLNVGDNIHVQLDDGNWQFCQIAYSTGSGLGIVTELVAPLRRQANANAAIAWFRPTIICLITAPPFMSYRSVVSEGYTVEAVEVPV